MNRIYSLTWNRALGALQVASELARSKGSKAKASGASSPCRHPLALACVVALAMTALASPAWAAGCTVDGVAYSTCGANGGDASGRTGGTGSVTSGVYANSGGDSSGGNGAGAAGSGGAGGHYDSTVGGSGAGGGGTGGGARFAGAGGGGGGGLSSDGNGGGGGGGLGGAYYAGGGGGGGGLGHAYTTSETTTGSIVGGNGGNGGAGSSKGGTSTGGGAGGGAGVLVAADISLTNSSGNRIQGGSGGVGGDGASRFYGQFGGGGGGGGAGLLLAVSSQLGNQGAVVGGNGGNGGQGGYRHDGGNGGDGGAGVYGKNFQLTNTGNIFGGNGGAGGGSGSYSGAAGAGGVGVIATGGVQITAAGSIAGGLSGNGATRANAIDLSGGGNTLTLEVGSTITGNIVSTSGATNGGDTLILGDDTLDTSPSPGGNASLDIGSVSGFTRYEKNGSTTWTLTGTGNANQNWTIAYGVLEGDVLTFKGNIALAAGKVGYAEVLFDEGSKNGNGSTSGIYSGVISGNGDFIKADDGVLVLTATNTFSGVTYITGGTLKLQGGSIESSIVVVDSGATFDPSGTTTGASITSLLGSGNVTLGAKTLTLSDAGGTFSGTIVGTGGLTVTGGTEILTGANTFSGGAAVKGGTLEIAKGGTPGAAGVAVDDSAGAGSTLKVDSGATLANHIVLNHGATLDNAGALTDTTDTYAVESHTGTVTINNTGSITGLFATVYLRNGGDVTNDGINAVISSTSKPNITGPGAVFISGGVGQVINSNGARITGGATHDSGSGVLLIDGGNVTNTGSGSTITGTYVGVIAAAGATITNGAGALIQTTSILDGNCHTVGGCAIAGDASVTIQNAGTIKGTTSGLELFKGGSIDNEAGGVIEANGATGDCNTTGDCAIFTPSGGGVLTLTNAGTITGNVQMDPTAANVATLTAGGSIHGNLEIGTNASSTLTLNGVSAAPQLYSNAATGTTTFNGILAKDDSGTWIIDSNDLSGVSGTTIDAGTLQVGNGGTTGSIGNGDVADSGTLAFDRSDDVTYAGFISGTGSLTQAGDGTLTLSGANTFSGGTTISAGRLQVGNGGTTGSITGDVVDDAALVFNRSDAVVYGGVLSGSGSLTQAGSGTLTLNGASEGFAGATRVTAGGLVIGDDSHAGALLGGTVTVASGAALGGIGTVGRLVLAGALNPGGSIGTLHVAGDATFEKGSIFNVEASPDGKADQLAVGGSVTIKGGSVVTIAEPGDWAPRTEYTILTAEKGVSGSFGSIGVNLAFLTPVLAYRTNAVQLTLERNDVNFNAVAVTLNEKGVAAAENGLGFGNALYDTLVKLDASTARYAFAQTSGEYHASQQTARVSDSRFVREAMDQRLRQGDADAEAAKVGETHLTAWAHAWGHWGTADSDGNAGRLADNGDGLLIGADMPVGAHGRVGVTGGASRDSLSVGSRASWGKLTSQWLGAFGGFEGGAFALRGGMAYAWDQVPGNRAVNFSGYSGRSSGNAAGDTLTGFVEGAWTFKFAKGSVAPFVNLAHTRVETDASTEMGGAAALHANAASVNVSFGTVGARGELRLVHQFDLHGELGWQHAFGDTTPERILRFTAGSSSFTEYGVPVAKNAGLGRVGLGWHAGSVAIDADYEVLFGGGVKDQAAKLSVSVAF